MKYMTSDEIRDTWLNFFKEKGHYIEPSSSLIPKNDPTLLWINAGVAPLKKYFDGTEQPKHKRITNAQKAIRTNDIDNVGHTARHHTFFEMLGNFSIGDYFKEEVIGWAYELLTSEKYYGFPKEKLYISYYPDDLETKKLWIKCGIDESHMIPLKDNFWEVGQGPCGPDTEIYFDRGEKYDKEKRGIELLKNDEENDRYLEIWNIVFSTYNSEPGKKRSEYKELPQKNIDTGAGLERFACVLQDAETNFETDLFMPYIKYLEKHAKVKYEGEHKYSYQVIADHVRSVCFALSDGATFSNEGRGYVLRRLVRRMARQAQVISVSFEDLINLVDIVVDNMKHFYPYLIEKRVRVKKMLEGEVNKFAQVLKTGEKKIAQLIANTKGKVISGEEVFILSDTYGIPFDLTKEICEAKGYEINQEEYEKMLDDQKERARSARGERNSFAKQSKDLLEFKAKSEFTYEEEVGISAKVIGLFVDGVSVESITDHGEVVFDLTNFYAESGGQVSDTGMLVAKNFEANVISVSKAPNKQFLHSIEVLFGMISVNDTIKLYPDFKRREAIKKNHSAAHLLQSALKDLLSRDIHQEGSFVSEGEMRFDFNYDEKIDEEQISEIEHYVNELINRDIKSNVQVMDKKDALKTGAIALFDEKYDDRVRVVEFKEVSKEFCGGTHVKSTLDIMHFVIDSCFSVAAGIKRIVAYTGMKAYEYRKSEETILNDLTKLLVIKSRKEIKPKIISLNKNMEQMQKINRALKDKIASLYLKMIVDKKERHDNYDVYAECFDDLSHDQVLVMVKQLIASDNTIVLLCSRNEGKMELAVGVSANLNDRYSAGKIIKELASKINGSGGGRNDIAFGGASSSVDFNLIKKSLFEVIK